MTPTTVFSLLLIKAIGGNMDKGDDDARGGPGIDRQHESASHQVGVKRMLRFSV